jgi:hypothetical protein
MNPTKSVEFGRFGKLLVLSAYRHYLLSFHPVSTHRGPNEERTMSANHALGGARPVVRIRTELAYQMCACCYGLFPSVAECLCVYCDAKVCPSCIEPIDDIDEVVCLSCAGLHVHPRDELDEVHEDLALKN